MASGIVFFTYEWFEHARGNFDALTYVIALDLGLALLFVMLTEPRDGKVRDLSQPAAEAAARHGLGDWLFGVRWTNWRYLLPTLIVVDLMVLLAGNIVVTRSGFQPLGIVFVALLGVPAVPCFRAVVIGARRRVYIFDNGFIIARGARCRVFPYDELSGTTVQVPYGPATRDSIRLRRGTDRWVVINQQTAAHAIAAAVPHETVYDPPP
jgi:hypothetical protein